MIVGVFHEGRVDLHLTPQDRLERLRHFVPSRNLFVTSSELAVHGNHAEILLPGYGLFTQLVPARIELALVPVNPLLWHMMRRMRGAGREIDKEWLIRREGLLLPNPGHRFLRHILHQMI